MNRLVQLSQTTADMRPPTTELLAGTAIGAALCVVYCRQRWSNSVKSSKAQKHVEAWEKLNCTDDSLAKLPPSHQPCANDVHANVCKAVEERVECRGSGSRDWLVLTSHYAHGQSAHPHAAVKREVNMRIAQMLREICGAETLAQRLRRCPEELVLVLDAPSFGTCRAIASVCGGASLLHSPQLVVPQADLGQYFAMVRNAQVRVGVVAQRLDHWLICRREDVHSRNLRCLCAFFDYECRALGSRSEALCPMADLMRYFRCGFPSDESVLAITVGLWPGVLGTCESVIAAVKEEAHCAGFDATLVEKWEYRLVALVFRLRRQRCDRGADTDDGAVHSPNKVSQTNQHVRATAEPSAVPVPAASHHSEDDYQVDGGPTVIGADGCLRQVKGWVSLSEVDREWTCSQVSIRNAKRLTHLHRVDARFEYIK